MQRGLSGGNAVCLSVCPSVTRVYCDKTNESSAHILIPDERNIHLLFRTRILIGGGRPLVPEILGQTDPPSFKIGDFQSIFARTASGLTPSEKVIMANRTQNELYNEPKMNSVRCP